MIRSIKRGLLYAFLIALATVMIYPLLWMAGSSFKENQEIFTSLSIFPSKWDFSAYPEGWRGNGRITYTRYFLNTFLLVVPTVACTVMSSTVVAFGFARFKFPCDKLLFAVMLSTLLLPEQTLLVPRYLIFKKLNWLDSYKTFIIPALFATYPFFIYMMIQFIRGIPRELDESAKIDGCNAFQIFGKIILPLSKPAMFSVIIFQFVWRWNDFFNPLIYINDIKSIRFRWRSEVRSTYPIPCTGTD